MLIDMLRPVRAVKYVAVLERGTIVSFELPTEICAYVGSMRFLEQCQFIYNVTAGVTVKDRYGWNGDELENAVEFIQTYGKPLGFVEFKP